MQSYSTIQTIARTAIPLAIGASGTRDFMLTRDTEDLGDRDLSMRECEARAGVVAAMAAARGIRFHEATASQAIARDGIRSSGETLSREITGDVVQKDFRISAVRETTEALVGTTAADLAIGVRTAAQRMLRTSPVG